MQHLEVSAAVRATKVVFRFQMVKKQPLYGINLGENNKNLWANLSVWAGPWIWYNGKHFEFNSTL